jgi:ankyrin repeat domain-containing protein 50
MEALLKQLALHGLTSHSSDLLKDLKSKQRHPSIGDLMILLKNEVKTYSGVFIVIDALDECSDVVRKDLMSKIQSLTFVKILVTSRPIDTIGHDVGADCRLDIFAKDSDIKCYLEGQLSSSHGAMMRRLITRSSSIREKDIITKVTMKAQGM